MLSVTQHNTCHGFYVSVAPNRQNVSLRLKHFEKNQGRPGTNVSSFASVFPSWKRMPKIAQKSHSDLVTENNKWKDNSSTMKQSMESDKTLKQRRLKKSKKRMEKTNVSLSNMKLFNLFMKNLSVSNKNIMVLKNKPKENNRLCVDLLKKGVLILAMIIVVNLYPTSSTHAAELSILNKKQKMDSISSIPTTTMNSNSIFMAGLLIAFSSAIFRVLGLKTLSKRILISATRMTFQLLFAGSFVLSLLFQNNQPILVFIWTAFLFQVATKEVSSNIKYKYDLMAKHCTMSLLVGVGSTLVVTLYAILKKAASSTVKTWDARTVIPMTGILIGNSLSAISLGLNVLLSEFAENRESLELRLSRGASIKETALPLVEKSFSLALTPKFNNMAAAGIISMPGTMTGQILGGASPLQAAMYQVVIFCGISTASCISLIVLSYLVLHRMFHYPTNSLVSLDRSTLIKKEKTSKYKIMKDVLSFWRKDKSKKSLQTPSYEDEHSSLNATEKFILTHEYQQPINNANDPEILTIDNLVVKRTKLTVSLQMRHGDRIGISGPSGIGKTQLLRTIAQLDEAAGGSMVLESQTLIAPVMFKSTVTDEGDIQSNSTIFGNEWRSHVSWVSQDRPLLEGTPSQFYEEILSYQAQTGRETNTKSSLDILPPAEISKDWFLSPSIYNKPWNTLSGGEAQRATLAIALSLNPDVLLLDEPTSACDEAATKAIEKTLSDKKIPILIVSHDVGQIDRFCTSQIKIARDFVA